MSALPDPLELAALRGCRVARQLVDASGSKLHAYSLDVVLFFDREAGVRVTLSAGDGDPAALLDAAQVVGVEFALRPVPGVTSDRLVAMVEGVELVAYFRPGSVPAWVPLATPSPAVAA